MEGALSSEKPTFGKVPSGELHVGESSLGKERIECSVPIIARQDHLNTWQASLELPAAMTELAIADQYRILAAVEESVAELQRLHAFTYENADENADADAQDATIGWLRLACSLWISTGFDGNVQCSVNFEWPEMWIDFPSPARASVLDGIDRMLGEVRHNLDRSSMVGAL